MHAKLLGEFGGLPGLPRAELLQSSLARPQQLLAYGEPPPSIWQDVSPPAPAALPLRFSMRSARWMAQP